MTLNLTFKSIWFKNLTRPSESWEKIFKASSKLLPWSPEASRRGAHAQSAPEALAPQELPSDQSTLRKLFKKSILSRPPASRRRERFMPKSLDSTSLGATEYITASTGNRLVLVFVDVSKAFDRVWHEGVVYKLLLAKFLLHLTKIVASYLYNRILRVKLEDFVSSRRPLVVGVPQGSQFSPLLFVLYTKRRYHYLPVGSGAKRNLFT